MEPAVTMRAASKAAMAPPRRFTAISAPATSFGGGGGGGRFSVGGGRGGGGEGGGDSSDAGAFVAAAAAVAALGETEVDGDDPDAIVLHVGGMSCGGCAGKVKRILESQPEVITATIDFEKAIAFVWTTPESRATEDWKKELGEKLANHLTTCGFQSHLQGEGDTKESNASAMSNECP